MPTKPTLYLIATCICGMLCLTAQNTIAQQNNGAQNKRRPPARTTLPNSAGQVLRAYDIRPYTNRHSEESKPEQTVVDWILRETGTEAWFTEPAGMLSANRATLKVYHTPAMQKVVADIVARFVRNETDTANVGVRVVTVDSPAWRTRALPRMQSVPVKTPGTQAWLCEHEDAALILADLRSRAGFREHNSPNLMIRNGDSHTIERTRPTSYVRGIRQQGSNTVGFGGLDMGQIDEGFKLTISPLLARDPNEVDVVIHIDSQQVEKFTSIAIPNPNPANPRQLTDVQIPQTSAWGIHERFRWPANKVLVIGCGMVASPAAQKRAPRLLAPPVAARSDALLFVDLKGPPRKNAPIGNVRQAAAGEPNYRGRY